MVEIRRSGTIGAPVDAVWGLLRDFNGQDRWHPAVATSVLRDGASGDQVGAIRDLRLLDGSCIREQLLAHSDRQFSFSYCVLEAPVMLRNYVASMRLRPVTSDGSCLVEWRATFDPPEADVQRLSHFVQAEIIDAGLVALRTALRDRPAIVSVLSNAQPAPQHGADAVAVVLSRHGGADAMELRRVRVSDPGLRQVRLRQTAIGVNFIDVYCRRGSFDLVAPGGVLGMEAAGIVESVGPGVDNLRVGERVGYACAPPGAYASLRTMSTELLVPLPDLLSDVSAAGILLKGITASFLLHDVYAVKRGDFVLVHAAAGGVGQILCPWAKALGATVIGATSSESKAALARRVGCDHVLIYGQSDFADAARRLAAGEGVNVVYDAVGKDTFAGSVRALATRGHLVSFGQASGDVGAQSIDRLASHSITVSRPNYAHYTDTPSKLKAQADRLFAALRAGSVVAEPPTVYPLAEVQAAHRDLEARRSTGSLVLVP